MYAIHFPPVQWKKNFGHLNREMIGTHQFHSKACSLLPSINSTYKEEKLPNWPNIPADQQLYMQKDPPLNLLPTQGRYSPIKRKQE